MNRPENDKKYTVLIGSVRSSKTWAVTAKLIVHLCTYAVEGRRVIFGKTKQTVYKNVLLDLFEIVGKENYSYNQSSGELWLFGSQWFVMGAQDEGSMANILGMTIGLAICDEIVKFPRSFVMQLFLRMSPSGSRMYATTNPDNPNHFFKTEVLDNKNFEPDLNVMTFDLDDNPNIDEKEKQRIKASQLGVFYLRFILGQWVAAQGAIYRDCWKDELKYNDATRPVGLYGWGGYVDNLVFIDYGTANPFCALEAIDDGHALWIDRMYWWDSDREMKQKTDAQYADDIAKWISPEGLILSDGTLSRSNLVDSRHGLPRFVVDPSAASFKLELQGRGLWVVDADNDVLDGIRKTSTVMARQLIRVHEDCKPLLNEIPAYMWDDKKTKVGEEAPIKINDHACDALRYGVKEVFSDYRLLAA
jgi:PBSX family phage terminase large subunit